MKNTVIVACATLKDELNFVMENANISLPVEWVDSGLHTWPQKLHTRITAVMESLPDKYDTVLLLFGFCGNSLVGVKAGKRRLIMPLVADCIPIFLGSNDKHKEIGGYTYFFTCGYLNSERNFITEMDDMIKRYGEKRAATVSKKMIANYKQFSVIDTGAYDVVPIYNKVKAFADKMDIPVNTIDGNMRIIENLIKGNYEDGEFLIVEPGSEIMFEHTLLAGQPQENITKI